MIYGIFVTGCNNSSDMLIYATDKLSSINKILSSDGIHFESMEEGDNVLLPLTEPLWDALTYAHTVLLQDHCHLIWQPFHSRPCHATCSRSIRVCAELHYMEMDMYPFPDRQEDPIKCDWGTCGNTARKSVMWCEKYNEHRCYKHRNCS